MTIIGLAGYAGSGKDTVGEFVRKGLRGTWINVAFATRLKESVGLALGLSLKKVNENKRLLRPLMVELGKAGRSLDPDWWISHVSEILAAVRSADYATICDVRYANEGEWIISKGGHIFFLDRPGIGPANDEERDSIAELRRVLNPVVVTNAEGAPEQAAATILEHIKGKVAA